MAEEIGCRGSLRKGRRHMAPLLRRTITIEAGGKVWSGHRGLFRPESGVPGASSPRDAGCRARTSDRGVHGDARPLVPRLANMTAAFRRSMGILRRAICPTSGIGMCRNRQTSASHRIRSRRIPLTRASPSKGYRHEARMPGPEVSCLPLPTMSALGRGTCMGRLLLHATCLPIARDSARFRRQRQPPPHRTSERRGETCPAIKKPVNMP